MVYFRIGRWTNDYRTDAWTELIFDFPIYILVSLFSPDFSNGSKTKVTSTLLCSGSFTSIVYTFSAVTKTKIENPKHYHKLRFDGGKYQKTKKRTRRERGFFFFTLRALGVAFCAFSPGLPQSSFTRWIQSIDAMIILFAETECDHTGNSI